MLDPRHAGLGTALGAPQEAGAKIRTHNMFMVGQGTSNMDKNGTHLPYLSVHAGIIVSKSMVRLFLLRFSVHCRENAMLGSLDSEHGTPW